jgi:hypothetical protein
LQPHSVLDRISQLNPTLKWALDFVDCPDGFDHIAQCIQEHTCSAVTDASLKLPGVTAAFTLVGPTDQGQVKAAVHAVPGPIKEGNSYRAELSGILGIIILGHVICQHFNINQGSIHIRCDNESSLRVFGQGYVPNPSNDSFDLINAIWHMIKESPLKWTAEWILGHQDNYGIVTKRFALLNCEMDARAKQYLPYVATVVAKIMMNSNRD